MTIEKFAPAEVQIGKPAAFEILVRNVGQVRAQSVVVKDQIPRKTRLVGTTPDAQQTPEGEAINGSHATTSSRNPGGRRYDAAVCSGVNDFGASVGCGICASARPAAITAERNMVCLIPQCASALPC